MPYEKSSTTNGVRMLVYVQEKKENERKRQRRSETKHERSIYGAPVVRDILRQRKSPTHILSSPPAVSLDGEFRGGEKGWLAT